MTERTPGISPERSLVLASNRPFDTNSPGGLVTALGPLMVGVNHGISIGTHVPNNGREEEGTQEALRTTSSSDGVDVRLVALTAEQNREYYGMYSNEVLWPILHSMLRYYTGESSRAFPTYRRVNSMFAEAIRQNSTPDEIVFVQDYHLMLVADKLRKSPERKKQKVGFFLHTPFPAPAVFSQIPQHEELLEGLLQYNLVGFHTEKDRANFADCVDIFLRDKTLAHGEDRKRYKFGDRFVTLGAFPISIDPKAFTVYKDHPDVIKIANGLRAQHSEEFVFFDACRSDYTKGIVERLEALDVLFQRFPDTKGELALIQAIAQNRSEIPTYASLIKTIEEKVREVNRKHGRHNWRPVHSRGAVGKEDLVARYMIANGGWVNSIADGMNLVAKEYVVCGPDDGVLILSRGAGASRQLREALLINPTDVDEVISAVFQAMNMPEDEKKARMMALRANVYENDIYKWGHDILTAIDNA